MVQSIKPYFLMTPFFSIIIPTYNRSKFIGSAIESVINQTYTDWELIIIDDGSTDNTKEIVSNFHDPRILYKYQNNQERSAARNNGIKIAKGEWICFLDSDDVYKVHHLETFKLFINSNNIIQPSMILSLSESKNGLNTNNYPPIETKLNKSVKEVFTKFILCNNVCIHHKIFEHNLFDNRFRLWEDTHLWVRIAAQFKIYQLDEITTCQFIHKESTVQQLFHNVNIIESSKEIEAINDLFSNYKNIIEGKLTEEDRINEIDKKYRMYLYLARQNKQPLIALNIWIKALINKPSYYILSELPKIFINAIGLGLLEKR